MEIIIQKFGGSSVANTEKLKKVCTHILREVNKGNKVIAVVSAQGNTTDKLIEEELELTENPCKREHDVLVSVGEQVTVAKLAILLKEKGYKAISYLGWQIPIITDSNFGDADVLGIGNERIAESLAENDIIVVAGFQGVDQNNHITTLGRGGSDTTAIAMAAALKADSCEIYTDVDGIYDTDPNQDETAEKYETISYDKMIEMAENGAKVLHSKCVKLAKKHQVKIIVKSTFKEESKGTIVE